jgi:hypothetical protein
MNVVSSTSPLNYLVLIEFHRTTFRTPTRLIRHLREKYPSR